MTKSDSIINISKALALFHVKIEKVKKDATNPFFKSKYASLSNILEAINIPLAETGLVYTQHPSGANDLITILIHADSGEFFESCYNMPVAKQNDPQAVGSSITYARRYALGAILGLNIDDDDDGSIDDSTDDDDDSILDNSTLDNSNDFILVAFSLDSKSFKAPSKPTRILLSTVPENCDRLAFVMRMQYWKVKKNIRFMT